jgi:hypothetical protein
MKVFHLTVTEWATLAAWLAFVGTLILCVVVLCDDNDTPRAA